MDISTLLYELAILSALTGIALQATAVFELAGSPHARPARLTAIGRIAALLALCLFAVAILSFIVDVSDVLTPDWPPTAPSWLWPTIAVIWTSPIVGVVALNLNAASLGRWVALDPDHAHATVREAARDLGNKKVTTLVHAAIAIVAAVAATVVVGGWSVRFASTNHLEGYMAVYLTTPFAGLLALVCVAIGTLAVVTGIPGRPRLGSRTTRALALATALLAALTMGVHLVLTLWLLTSYWPYGV